MNTIKQIQLFKAAGGKVELEVSLEQDTVWITQTQMCEVFDKNKRTDSEHIRNIFKVGELSENAVVRKFRTTAVKPTRKRGRIYFYDQGTPAQALC